MPTPGGTKRKQGERTYAGDEVSRPSPYRPQDQRLAQQSQSPSSNRGSPYHEGRPRAGRRVSRGGGRGVPSANPSVASPDPAPTVQESRPTPAPTDAPPDTTMANTSTKVPEPAEEVLLSIPYSYSTVTDDVCAAWEEQGRQSVLSQLTEAVTGGDETTTSLIVQELVQSVLAGRVDATNAGQLITDAIEHTQTVEGDAASFDLHTIVSDSFSVVCEDSPTFPISRLANFILAARIDHGALQHELDSKLLEKLGLIRNTFDRMSIRKQTNIVYRQANFNLMREESEGFAKLVTEVFSSSLTDEPSGENVNETVEKVKALIGAFDLDVGRSLDVVLDVFGSVLVKSYRFLVKFLRASPWWPRQANHGSLANNPNGLPAWALPGVDDWFLSDEQKLAIAQQNLIRDSNFWEQAREHGLSAFYRLGLPEVADGQVPPEYSNDDFAKSWVQETGTRPPMGNRDAAQLLGFKLRFYSSSPARDETDTLPDNLMYLSALLIKIGFISLKDLYPHLWRPDESMEELRAQKAKEKEEREKAARPGAGAKNALSMAAALPDDTLPAPVNRLRDASTRAATPSRESEAEKSTKDATSEPAEQKIALLKALLAIGALPEALFMIGRFPWVLDLYSDLPEYIFRILNHSIDAVSESSRPLATRDTLDQSKPLYETDIPGVSKGQVKLTDNPERKVLRWAQLDKADSSDGNSYRYYWDEWSDLIPVCQTVDDVFTLFDTLLPLVGVKIGQDPALVSKIARIGKHSLQEDPSEPNRDRWLDLCKRVLLPCVSLTKGNAGVVNEVFELLTFYPTRTRFLLYLEWRDGRTSRNPDIRAAVEQARAETLDILKRISKTNIRPMARALAKVAYANPHIVTSVALRQIESYDSISAVFVEGSRYFTDLGYDVLTCNLIGSMSKAGRNKIQDGGIFVSRWLTALSKFAGDIYKRYNMMKPAPVLQYVARQLDQGNTGDLKMLESIVTSMGGIANDTSYNEAQLQAMGGGPLLQSQTILQLLDQRHEKSVQITARRLMGSLHTTELIGKFLLSMAQQRQACIFQDPEVPLKVIGNTYDETQRVLAQYLDFLQYNMGLEAFAQAVPDVVTLVTEYEIRPEIAFWICRSVIAKNIAHERERLDDTALTAQESNGDIDMKDDANESSEEDGEAIEDEPETTAATPTADDILNASTESEPIEALVPANGDGRPWHPVLEKIMDQLASKLPEEVVQTIGVGFYVTFWQLSLYDITIPKKAYQDEMARQKKKRDAVKADRSSLSSSASKKKEEQLQVFSQLIDDLLAENGQHVKAQLACRKRLNAEKMAWFAGQSRSAEHLNAALMEYCFLPRIMASALDAYFSFAFVKYLHAMGTPNFRTLGFYDLLFKPERLISLIFMSSSKEAENFGRFLNELLKDLSRWQKSRSTYEKEAWGTKKELPGFALKVEAGKPVLMLAFDQFRKIHYRWHIALHTAFQKCLKSPEYMHIRNAISVLYAVSEGGAYPVVNIHGVNLQTTIDKLRSSEMQDLVTASTSLLSGLKRGEKHWISPGAFCPGMQQESTPVPPTNKEASAAKSTEQATGKSEDEGGLKNAATTEGETKPVLQTGEQKTTDTKSEDKSKLPSRPPINGESTPRAKEERSSSQSRSGHLEAPKTFPKRPSPPPRHAAPASLPNRPDPSDPRNGHRDSGRSSRPPPESVRPPHPRDARDPRGGYRAPEGSYEDFEPRPARRYERTDAPVPGSRDDRGYGRDRETGRGHERPRDIDRDRLAERDRPPTQPHSRERDTSERAARAGPPSRQQHDETGSRPSSAAPARPGSSQSDSLNPARAAMMGMGSDTVSPGPARGPANDRPQRPGRAPSPRRGDERRGPPRNERDAPHPRDPRPDTPSGRHVPPATGPAGRSEHGTRHPRDNRAPYNAPVDMEHGRLEQDPNHRPPVRTDRNAEPEVPSGPRGRGPMSAPRGRGAPAINTHAAQSDRGPPPTGPSGRHSRGPSNAENTSAPPAPDTSGVHPSRRLHIPSPTEPSHTGGPLPSGPSGGARSGAPAHAPSGPSPTSRGPPIGPNGGGDGLGRGSRSSRSQMTTVNNTLAQAAHPSSGRGGGGSGRGGRPPSGAIGGHGGPPPPSGPERSSSRSENYGQNDLFGAHGNPNDVPIGPRPTATRQDSIRERRPTDGERVERGEDRRSSRRHDDGRSEREPRDNRPERDGPPRRDDRPRREDPQHVDDRSGMRPSYRGGPGPRDDGTMNNRKHPRGDEGGPGGQYSGGGGGRGGSRVASESKRPRRGG
ncbi:uncharacterized protein HMPREF1541_04513 [Cyphellophora europaea CBS 101466]|uniref:THO complex subunit 2 n=1 Tax=Cyphellophora europaea (strain CBS 101466) TaxID=1220924 RepID=W2RUW7_CYPE1|nr:uncharacterized protein HMPREF1541_04513 [Cyphellophora europaea CBS 101466]ETN40237.1 hypothetical protein HMPREF1541_04513 [Cyphellophora europaea CBS 101466]